MRCSDDRECRKGCFRSFDFSMQQVTHLHLAPLVDWHCLVSEFRFIHRHENTRRSFCPFYYHMNLGKAVVPLIQKKASFVRDGDLEDFPWEAALALPWPWPQAVNYITLWCVVSKYCANYSYIFRVLGWKFLLLARRYRFCLASIRRTNNGVLRRQCWNKHGFQVAKTCSGPLVGWTRQTS